VLRWVAWIWIACLLIASLQPFRPRATSHGTGGHWVAHVVEFGFPALLLLLLSDSRTQKWVRASRLFGLAVAIELAQSRLYSNPVEWNDILVDGLGILLAFALSRSRLIPAGLRLDLLSQPRQLPSASAPSKLLKTHQG
jgi:hypothetical protein